jgi:hypothetical protein
MLVGLLCPSLPPRNDQIEFALEFGKRNTDLWVFDDFHKKYCLDGADRKSRRLCLFIKRAVAQAIPENNVEPDKLYNASRVSMGTH